MCRSGTGPPLRRSARLKLNSQQRPTGKEGPPVRGITPSTPPYGPQIETGTADEQPSTSERNGLARQQIRVEQNEVQQRAVTVTVTQQPLTRKNLAQFNKMASKKEEGTEALTSTPVDQSSDAVTSGTSSTPATVRDRMYRQNNLAFNRIHVRDPYDPLPSGVSGYINDTLRAARHDSSELSAEEIRVVLRQLSDLTVGACDEDELVAFLNATVFPNPLTDPLYGSATGLTSSSKAHMSRHLVPTNPTYPVPYRVTQPRPDRLYGYSGKRDTAFTEPQLLAQTILHPEIPGYPVATSSGIRFPFLAIEFKTTQGDLWVATNQCAGASSACLNAVDRLNTALLDHQSGLRVDNLSYSIAVDNNTAELYVSWKGDDLNHYLQRIGAFLLSSEEHFQSFRKQVRNILDWGRDTRLTQIRDALDTILEEHGKKASEDAKARPSPSDAATRDSKMHKSC